MAAIHREVRSHSSNWNDWDRSRKLVVALMMLLNDEAPVMLNVCSRIRLSLTMEPLLSLFSPCCRCLSGAYLVRLHFP